MLSQQFHSFVARMVMCVIVLGLGVLIGAQFTDLAEASPLSSQAEPLSQGNTGLGIEGTADIRRFVCSISEADEWEDGVSSILIGCNPSDGPIAFFATPTSDWKRAARVLSIALTAQAAGKPIFVDYDPGNANVSGCSAANCRNIFRIGMYN